MERPGTRIRMLNCPFLKRQKVLILTFFNLFMKKEPGLGFNILIYCIIYFIFLLVPFYSVKKYLF